MKNSVSCACYVRVSTDNQLENYSIEEQIDRLTAYCKAKDFLITKFYTDGGYSGGNLERPALQQMLSDIRNGHINTVIVYKLDRLSRSQKDTLFLIEDEFLANNVDFISINENFDTSTPFGRAMIGVLSVFSQLEKDQITERFTMGRIGRAKNGYFHGGGMSPVGYDYVDGLLVVNEYEALQVVELYERFAKGYPLHDCWRYMQKNYKTKYGAWSSEALVRNVLKNNVYLGHVKFKGETYKGVHTPIVTEELYEKVQEMFANIKRNTPEFRRTPFKASTLLSGIIYCGNCGARYHGEHGNYSCYSRTKGDKKYIMNPDCKNKKWKVEELDNLVIDYISKLTFEEGDTRIETKRPKKDYSKRLSEIDKELSRLIDLYKISNIPFETISAKVEAITAEKNTLEAEMQKKAPEPPSGKDMLRFKEKFLSLLDGGALQEKRAALAYLVERIIITGDDVEIIIR